MRRLIESTRHSGVALAVIALIQGLLWPQRMLLAFARVILAPPVVAHAMRDNNLFFRSTTDSVTATETSGWVAINGTPAIGLAITAIVPKGSIGDTLAADLQFSTDASNSDPSVSMRLFFLASRTQAYATSRRFTRRIGGVRRKYARVILTVAGTSPDFGAVSVMVDDPRAQDNYLTQGVNRTDAD